MKCRKERLKWECKVHTWGYVYSPYYWHSNQDLQTLKTNAITHPGSSRNYKREVSITLPACSQHPTDWWILCHCSEDLSSDELLLHIISKLGPSNVVQNSERDIPFALTFIISLSEHFRRTGLPQLLTGCLRENPVGTFPHYLYNVSPDLVSWFQLNWKPCPQTLV